MEIIYLLIVLFLIVLAVFDLTVGVSNDAVNFINSAIGSKVARYRVIIAVAAVGVFVGASMSNGMMDVARHGIFTPGYFTFFEVMCVFLAVMVTDVILLDVFNSMGMPTSTTVSMVFELLGGAFAISLIKIAHGAVGSDGVLLGMGDLINTSKALSVILAIFLSVAVAFVFGSLVMWLSRIVFSYATPSNRSPKTILFGALSGTTIVWFLLINGLKGSSFMTPAIGEWISAHTWMIIGSCFAAMSVVMSLLALLRVSILRTVVLMGTFSLAMAFAGNDLVNFVGVPFAGLSAYQDWASNGAADINAYTMGSLGESAHTPVIYLIAAGLIMVLALVFSKKAQNVVKTSVDLSRQDEGDEMFGSSGVARTIVRVAGRTSTRIVRLIPHRARRWIDSRFRMDYSALEQGAAFDMVRASVNLVLAGLLVALGTSFKLPLSTTYVTFMVAMGASLADRAWGRESAVFRVTGVLSVIGGWFLTAGVAFFACFVVALLLYYGNFPVMFAAIVLAVTLLVRSNVKYARKTREKDTLAQQLVRCNDEDTLWQLLNDHIRLGNARTVGFVLSSYRSITTSLLEEHYGPLKRNVALITEQRGELKRQRKREIMAMRRMDPAKVMQRNTWYFMGINSCQQMLYSLKRTNDPVKEHVGNSFSPLPEVYHKPFIAMRDDVLAIYDRAHNMLLNGDYSDIDYLRSDAEELQSRISVFRKEMMAALSDGKDNVNTMLLMIHIIQESDVLVGSLKHMMRGMKRFAGE